MKQKEINQFLLANYRPSLYPFFGNHYIIQYYSHNEGNSVVIAKSEAAAIKCLDELNKHKNGYLLEAVKFSEKVDITSYPKQVFLSRAQKHHKELVNSWSGDLQAKAYSIFEQEKVIVGPFKECIEYKPGRYYKLKKTHDMWGYYQEKHCGCLNCQTTKMTFSCEIDIDALYIKNAPKRDYISVFNKEIPTHSIQEAHGLEVKELKKEDLLWKQPIAVFNILPSNFKEVVNDKMDLYQRQRKILDEANIKANNQRAELRKQEEVRKAKEELHKIFG